MIFIMTVFNHVYCAVFFLLFNFIYQSNAQNRIGKSQIEVISYCNDPGQPPKSQITSNKFNYTDGETVTYKCNDYTSLNQYRNCVRGKWQGDTPICGEAFRDNDLELVRFYNGDRQGAPLVSEYNVSGQLKPFTDYKNSFVKDRLPHTAIRGLNASNYFVELSIQKLALLQMVRFSFSLVNYQLNEQLKLKVNFDVQQVNVGPNRNCHRVYNVSYSAWESNSTHFDFWYFCRSKSNAHFNQQLKQMSKWLMIETSANFPVEIDLTTLILAQQYSVRNNLSQPICGQPEIPFGSIATTMQDQTSYTFTCEKNFKKINNEDQSFLINCGHDAHWEGQMPQCYPNTTCPAFEFNRTQSAELLKYDGVYYINQDEWLPIPGTRALFGCIHEKNILRMGEEILVCQEDGNWSGTMPRCRRISSPVQSAFPVYTIIIICLIVIPIVTLCVILICLFLRRPTAMHKNPQVKNEEEPYYSTIKYCKYDIDFNLAEDETNNRTYLEIEA